MRNHSIDGSDYWAHTPPSAATCGSCETSGTDNAPLPPWMLNFYTELVDPPARGERPRPFDSRTHRSADQPPLSDDFEKMLREMMSPLPAQVALRDGVQAIDEFLRRSPEAEQCPLPEDLHRIVERERRMVRNAISRDRSDGATPTLPGPVQAILADQAIPHLDDYQLEQRTRQILRAVGQPHTGHALIAPALAAGLGVSVGALSAFRLMPWDIGVAAACALTFLAVTLFLLREKHYPTITFDDALALLRLRRDRIRHSDRIKQWTTLATIPTDAVVTAPPLPQGSAPTPPTQRRLAVADIHQTRDDLLEQWGTYRLDIEAWYITKPLLHDTTGTVPTTVAYERALQDFLAAVDNLPAAASQDQIDHAGRLADAAWAAWHEADDYAGQVGLGDRSPTERAALQRLGKLVERLTRSAAADPELATVKRAIQECLDKVTTVSVSWADISSLPAIEARGLLPQITAGPVRL